MVRGRIVSLDECLAALEPGERVLLSACVAGEPTRYDGAHKADVELLDRLHALGVVLVTVCPEVGGGLGTPRPGAEPRQGVGADVLAGRARVRTLATGKDVTDAFLRGASLAVEVARQHEVRFAILQERSPSCGVRQSHSGGGLAAGSGVAAEALRQAGVHVVGVN